MFVGHFAAALIAKKLAPSTSLAVLVTAALWLDLVWPVLLLAGVEHAEVSRAPGAVVPLQFTHYPFSHSLFATAGWAAAGGAVWWWRTGSVRPAWVVAALVVSHWLLDWLVHVPDLPLALGDGPYFGLGLWQWPLPALALELTLFVVGVVVFLRTTTRSGGARRWPFMSLVAFLVVIQFANVFGPPPPDITPVVWTGMATWLLVAWAWRADLPRIADGTRPV